MTSDPSVPPDLPPSASGKGVPPDPVATPGEYLVKPESAVKFTRAAALWSALITGFVILIVLLVFIMQNTDSTSHQLLRLGVESACGRGDSVGRGVRRPADGCGRHRQNRSAAPRGEEKPQVATAF